MHSSPYVEAITIESLQWHAENNKVLSNLKDHIIEGKIPNASKLPELQPFSKIFNEVTITEGGLILRGERIILPRDLLKRAIEKAHQGGHPGESSLKRRFRMHFWYPGINKAVKEKVKRCLACQVHTDKATKEPQTMFVSPEYA